MFSSFQKHLWKAASGLKLQQAYKKYWRLKLSSNFNSKDNENLKSGLTEKDS